MVLARFYILCARHFRKFVEDKILIPTSAILIPTEFGKHKRPVKMWGHSRFSGPAQKPLAGGQENAIPCADRKSAQRLLETRHFSQRGNGFQKHRVFPLNRTFARSARIRAISFSPPACPGTQEGRKKSREVARIVQKWVEWGKHGRSGTRFRAAKSVAFCAAAGAFPVALRQDLGIAFLGPPSKQFPAGGSAGPGSPCFLRCSGACEKSMCRKDCLLASFQESVCRKDGLLAAFQKSVCRKDYASPLGGEVITVEGEAAPLGAQVTTVEGEAAPVAPCAGHWFPPGRPIGRGSDHCGGGGRPVVTFNLSFALGRSSSVMFVLCHVKPTFPLRPSDRRLLHS